MGVRIMAYSPKVSVTDCGIEISGLENFSLADTLDCGQAFRWKNENGIWNCIVGNRAVKAAQTEPDGFTVFGANRQDYDEIWAKYFDIGRDYQSIIKTVSVDETIKKAAEHSGGIRVLRQEPWETLCSFIISQNNNIPRIKGIIERLCENFGEKIDGGYTFPSAEIIACKTVDELSPLRSGFRAKYIIDAAQKVASGEVDLDLIDSENLDEARAELMKIKGVGAKVADCTLLFGFGKIEAFPKDVWIKRAIEVLFNGELPAVAVPYAGIVQQMIFNYARQTKLNI